jgi:hypothetical protein
MEPDSLLLCKETRPNFVVANFFFLPRHVGTLGTEAITAPSVGRHSLQHKTHILCPHFIGCDST